MNKKKDKRVFFVHTTVQTIIQFENSEKTNKFFKIPNTKHTYKLTDLHTAMHICSIPKKSVSFMRLADFITCYYLPIQKLIQIVRKILNRWRYWFFFVLKFYLVLEQLRVIIANINFVDF